MREARRIKVSYDGSGHSYNARIVDAKTGEIINYISRVEITLDVNEVPRATLHMIMPVLDIEIDADVHTICPLCGQEKGA